MLDAVCWMLDSGYWMLDTGCWILDAGCWMLDTGFWILDGMNVYIIIVVITNYMEEYELSQIGNLEIGT